MGKKKDKQKPQIMVPIEFGFTSHGGIRMMIHIDDPLTTRSILKQIGESADAIMDDLLEHLEQFIKEKEKQTSDQAQG